MQTVLDRLAASRDRLAALRDQADAEREIRDRLICEAKDDGRTYAVVARAAGVDPSRVAQVMAGC